MITQLEKHFKLEKPKGKNYDFKQMFEELFRDLPINSDAQYYIGLALGDDISKHYSFNSSHSSIKGFLGEIYSNAFLYFMANGSKNKKRAIEAITPTGAFTTADKNQ